MKKLFALFICAIFVLSVSSFALWGIGGKKAETKTATVETKPMAKKMVTKKAVKSMKKVKKAKKAPMPVAPMKK